MGIFDFKRERSPLQDDSSHEGLAPPPAPKKREEGVPSLGGEHRSEPLRAPEKPRSDDLSEEELSDEMTDPVFARLAPQKEEPSPSKKAEEPSEPEAPNSPAPSTNGEPTVKPVEQHEHHEPAGDGPAQEDAQKSSPFWLQMQEGEADERHAAQPSAGPQRAAEDSGPLSRREAAEELFKPPEQELSEQKPFLSEEDAVPQPQTEGDSEGHAQAHEAAGAGVSAPAVDAAPGDADSPDERIATHDPIEEDAEQESANLELPDFDDEEIEKVHEIAESIPEEVAPLPEHKHERPPPADVHRADETPPDQEGAHRRASEQEEEISKLQRLLESVSSDQHHDDLEHEPQPVEKPEHALPPPASAPSAPIEAPEQHEPPRPVDVAPAPRPPDKHAPAGGSVPSPDQGTEVKPRIQSMPSFEPQQALPHTFSITPEVVGHVVEPVEPPDETPSISFLDSVRFAWFLRDAQEAKEGLADLYERLDGLAALGEEEKHFYTCWSDELNEIQEKLMEFDAKLSTEVKA